MATTSRTEEGIRRSFATAESRGATARSARGLSRSATQWRDREPGWFNAPVASFGPLSAGLLIVGLAPGLQGANRTGRPFTGDYAGDLLFATLDGIRLRARTIRCAGGRQPSNSSMRGSRMRCAACRPRTSLCPPRSRPADLSRSDHRRDERACARSLRSAVSRMMPS